MWNPSMRLLNRDLLNKVFQDVVAYMWSEILRNPQISEMNAATAVIILIDQKCIFHVYQTDNLSRNYLYVARLSWNRFTCCEVCSGFNSVLRFFCIVPVAFKATLTSSYMLSVFFSWPNVSVKRCWCFVWHRFGESTSICVIASSQLEVTSCIWSLVDQL